MTKLRDLQAIEAAFCNAHGISAEVQARSLSNAGLGDVAEEILNDAASAKYAKRQSFADVLAGIIEVNDPSYSGRWTVPAMLARINELDSDIRASSGVSTISLPGVLSNIANKSLLAGYEAQQPVLRKLARESIQDDFKEQTLYRVELTGDLMPKLGPAGEVKHGSMTESSHTNRPVTHAKSIAITEEMITNDDMGAFVQAGEMLGNECAKRIELELSGLLVDALAAQGADQFFDPSSNYLSGASTALSIDSLGLADAALADMVDVNGDPINLSPSFLVTTGDNRAVARQLMNSTEIRDPSGTSGTSNPYQNYAEPLTSNWLKSTRHATPAASTVWFLASVARMHAPLLLNFVKSNVPRVTTHDQDPNMLGMRLRCKLAFGCSLWDPKSIIAVAGA